MVTLILVASELDYSHKLKQLIQGEGMNKPDAESITGIAIYCSDPRASLWKYIKCKQLVKPQEMFTPLGALGAPICLARPFDLPIDFAYVANQLRVKMIKFPRIGKILIAGHDCGYYDELEGVFSIEDKKEDLRVGGRFLLSKFPNLTIEAYFGFENGGEIEFENVFFHKPSTLF